MVAERASWRRLTTVCLVLCMQIGWVGTTAAQDAAPRPGAYFLGTATTGGTYHPVGVALSTLIKLKLLPNFDVDLTAINTAGSTQNIDLLQRNDIQFAIVSALAGYDARTGTGQFSGAVPDENLRAITTLWLSTDHLVVGNQAVESGTIEDFLALRGQPVSLGREESGTLLGNRTLMAALGVDIDSEFQLVELGYDESADALAAGTIDGMSVSGGVPIAAVQSVFDRLGDKASVLEVNDEQLALIDRGRGIWQRDVIPSGTYPSQSRDVFTIGTPNILAVRADVDDEVVYQITKTIFEELEYLHGLHGATQQISLDHAVNSLPLPIHEGAARYFEEKGVELPPPPVELSSDLLTRYNSVEEARGAANQGVVTLFAGGEGDTMTRVATELASVVNAPEDGVRLLTNNGGGIGRNLTDLLYLRGVDAALVRADILNYARNENVYPAIQNQITYISEMFPEEIHLLVQDDISGVTDLTGKVINVGSEGSGSEITGSIILSQLGLNAEVTNFKPHLAIEKLRQGEIDAAFFVGGKPMPLLRQIPEDSGLKLMALPSVQYGDSYQNVEIRDFDYPNLTADGDIIRTLAVRTALLTYAWRTDSARYAALESLSEALFQHLLELQGDGNHPKWLEVDPTATFGDWARFRPAALWVEDNQGTARRIASEGRQRLQRIAELTAEPVGIERSENDPLPGILDVDSVFVPAGGPVEETDGDPADGAEGVVATEPSDENGLENGQTEANENSAGSSATGSQTRSLNSETQAVEGQSEGNEAAAAPSPAQNEELPTNGINGPTF